MKARPLRDHVQQRFKGFEEKKLNDGQLSKVDNTSVFDSCDGGKVLRRSGLYARFRVDASPVDLREFFTLVWPAASADEVALCVAHQLKILIRPVAILGQSGLMFDAVWMPSQRKYLANPIEA